MSQVVVTIRLNGNPYRIGCGVGEEEHVTKLGKEVDSIMQSLVDSVGQIGEARLLAMVALILADRAVSNTDETVSNTSDVLTNVSSADFEAAATALEMAAERILGLASQLTKP